MDKGSRPRVQHVQRPESGKDRVSMLEVQFMRGLGRG